MLMGKQRRQSRPDSRFSSISEDDCHVLPGQGTVREEPLAMFLDVGEKGIVMVWIVVGQDQSLDSRQPGTLDGLFIAGMAPTPVLGELLGSKLRVVKQQVGSVAEIDRRGIRSFVILNIGANHDRLLATDQPVAVRAAGMLVLLGCQNGSRKETNILVRQQEFKIRTHVAELHRKILALHGHGEDPFQIANRALAPQRKQRDLLSLDISGLEKGQPLNVIPMEVGKRDNNRLLSKGFIPHDFLTKPPDSCPGIDYPNIYRVIRGDENAAGAPAELVCTLDR